MPDIRVKICGLKTPADVAAVAASGAAYAGFVFFAKSPRNLTIPAARELALAAPVPVALDEVVAELRLIEEIRKLPLIDLRVA